MSAPNQGRQSPDPETQSGAQAPDPTASGQADAAPSETHAQDASDEQKGIVLESNPKGPLDDAAHEKLSKEGRGEGI
ncbi:MAG: hypothetical protein MMC33_006725 [Icmadophila ericetorum]|nr:hypothetical protein [Icmadophila ericetorum]